MDQAVSSNSQKWIRGTLLVATVIVVYVLNSFFAQLGEWFDIEAKIPNFEWIYQSAAIFIGIGMFVYLVTSKAVNIYLEEVYSELTKVVWAKRDETTKLTLGILVGVIITSIVLGFVDFSIGKIFGLLYK
jgi:preprotein translocase subunit SecE